jgi:RNA polymerase sigma factor (sigma-70 family)
MSPISGPSDAVAIRASCADPPAFAALFDRHWTRVRRYCVVRVGPPGEDLAAETFDVAFDHRRRYDGREDAGPWLLGIARNLVREWFRRSARADRGLRRSGPEVPLEPFDGALDRIEAEHLGPELATVLERLTPLERDTLLLYACLELTYEEIARATAVPVGTVRSRMHRARERVRVHLESRKGLPMDRVRAEINWVSTRLPEPAPQDRPGIERARSAFVARLSTAPLILEAPRRPMPQAGISSGPLSWPSTPASS